MKHFRGIDGLRAWLAWIVVLSHIVLHTAADQRIGALNALDSLATNAVKVFIIISGFVITHLLLTRREPYLPYITRRFLRIYPVYLICLAAGVLATYAHFSAFAGHPWGAWVPQPELITHELASLAGEGFGWNLLAHLTLFQGAIPNQLLDVSEYTFLGPAWSLSLEWQFYLVAPLVLYCLRTARGRGGVALAMVLAFAVYQRGWLGDFIDPSFLPGAGPYFAAGILTRLVLPKLPRLTAYPLTALLLAAALVLISHDLFPFVFWFAFVAWMRLEPSAGPAASWLRWPDAAFDSPLARFLGARSYSTYLVHEPLIHAVVYFCIKSFGMGMWPTVLVTVSAVPALTLLASALLYRWVEAPGIAYGRRLFAPHPAAVAQEA